MKENYVVLTLTGFRKQVFLLAPNETKEALNNNKAFVSTKLLHLADEFIKSLELRFVMTFFLFLNYFVKQFSGCRLGMTGVIKTDTLERKANCRVKIRRILVI